MGSQGAKGIPKFPKQQQGLEALQKWWGSEVHHGQNKTKTKQQKTGKQIESFLYPAPPTGRGWGHLPGQSLRQQTETQAKNISIDKNLPTTMIPGTFPSKSTLRGM